MNDLRKVIQEYQDVEIPDNLEFIVITTIRRREKVMRRNWILKTSLASVATLLIIFVGAVNLSSAAADAMSRIPAIRNIVDLVMFRRLVYQDNKHIVDIKVPQVEGLENIELEQALNAKYLDESIELYHKFLREIGEKELTPQILAVYTNYKVKTNVKGLFVLERIKTEIGASGKETVWYDNIDLSNQLIITLPSLFRDDSYIDVISANIRTQMQQQIDAKDGRMYFMKGDGSVGGFDRISSDQTFYIRSDAKLVIVFNEYEVAPGSMGIVEFVIPTEDILNILVSSFYIK